MHLQGKAHAITTLAPPQEDITPPSSDIPSKSSETDAALNEKIKQRKKSRKAEKKRKAKEAKQEKKLIEARKAKETEADAQRTQPVQPPRGRICSLTCQVSADLPLDILEPEKRANYICHMIDLFSRNFIRDCAAKEESKISEHLDAIQKAVGEVDKKRAALFHQSSGNSKICGKDEITDKKPIQRRITITEVKCNGTTTSDLPS